MMKMKNLIASKFSSSKDAKEQKDIKKTITSKEKFQPPKSNLPKNVLHQNIKMINNPPERKKSLPITRPKSLPTSKEKIDKNIDLKKLAKVTRDKKSISSVKDEKTKKAKEPEKKYTGPYKTRSHFLLDNKLQFKKQKSEPQSKASSKPPSQPQSQPASKKKTTREPVNKVRPRRSEIRKEVKKMINQNDVPDKKSNSDPKASKSTKVQDKKFLNQNFVRANMKSHYAEKKRIRPINIRKYKLNRGKAFYAQQKQKNLNANTETSNYLGKGDKGLLDIDGDKMNEDEDMGDKMPVFSEGFIQNEITPNKNENVITTRLTTALKSSLRKCVPLDTELKFLSKEFRYLLSDKKDEIEKLNQIKEEELNKKLNYNTTTPIKEELTESKMEIDEEQKTITKVNENDNSTIMTDEEISKLENDILSKVLEENFKHKHFLDGQLQTIKSILNNKRTLTIMQQGCGKSLCFQLSSLVMEGLCIVISPLISSITNYLISLPQFLPGASLTSFTSHRQRDEIFNAIKEKKIKILFTTPERFAVENFSDIEEISLVCFEDAASVCPMSHSFRTSYISCENVIKRMKPNSLLFLANNIGKSIKDYITTTFKIEKIIEVPLKISDKINISISKDENKLISLVKLLRNQKFKAMGLTVIFCNTIKTVNQVTSYLNQNGINASSYHSGKDELERSIVQNNFLKDKIKLLVCTSSFASSLTKKDVRLIVIFEMPNSIEQLIQQFGKNCASVGNNGDVTKKDVHCHIFLHDNDYFNQRKNILGDNIDKSKLLKFIDYLFMQILPQSTIQTTRIKRTYAEVMMGMDSVNKTYTQSASKDKNIYNHLPATISLNFNTVNEITDIKKQTQLFFLTSIISNTNLNDPSLEGNKSHSEDNDSSEDKNSNKCNISMLGIGPCTISIRFYKSTPQELAANEPIIKSILERAKEKQGAFTFSTIELCDVLGTTYMDLIAYLYKLQSKGEISYETKDDGVFLAIKHIPDSFKDLIAFLNLINHQAININLKKLNCAYILLRKYAALNVDAFLSKTPQIKCLSTYQSFSSYQDELKKTLLSYFAFDEDNADVLIAGNEIEKNVLLPIYNIETQRESSAIAKEIEDFAEKEVENNLGVNSVDIINILFGICFKGKEMKSYFSSPLWGKYINYNYDYLIGLCENAVTKAKTAIIEKGTPKKVKLMKTK